jgi:DNA-binding MarR family transcriptional regulator
MVATGPGIRLEALAHELLELVTLLGSAAPRGRRHAGDLKELEYLTLAILHDHGTMIVGDIQRLLGVLPAQMSRVIRALETKERPLITCQINPQDKRKIDVHLTPAGAKVLQEYEASRLQRIIDLLHDLPEDDQEELSRLLDKLRHRLAHAAEPERPEENRPS